MALTDELRIDIAAARAAIEGADTPREELSLPTGAEALAALERSVGVADPVWATVQAEQLTLAVPPMDSIEATMRLAGSHLREHAQQIAAGGAA